MRGIRCFVSGTGGQNLECPSDGESGNKIRENCRNCKIYLDFWTRKCYSKLQRKGAFTKLRRLCAFLFSERMCRYFGA